jgi:predicted nucleic acid-binding protein
MTNKNDFGKELVSISGNKALFLDSNIIIAYLYAKHKFHYPCYCFITYLLKDDVSLCISEVSISEVLFVLARTYFIDDQIEKVKIKNGRNPNSFEKNSIIKDWNRIIKKDPNLHKHYNQLAIDNFRPFLNVCDLIQVSEEQVQNAMGLAATTPLASADALIVSASQINCTGIVSLDTDLNKVDSLNLYTTSTENINYDVSSLIVMYDIKDLLVTALGVDGFIDKFGIEP